MNSLWKTFSKNFIHNPLWKPVKNSTSPCGEKSVEALREFVVIHITSY